MRKILLLILIVLLIGCSKKNEQILLFEAGSGGYTTYQNDNIKIKISDNIDEKESVYTYILNELQKINEFSPIENLEIQISKQYIVPNIDEGIKCDAKFLETEEFKKELIRKSYGIYDNWISEGLYAKIYEIEKKEVDYTTYYANNEFSLFGARFFEPFATKEEVENVQAASRDLVKYLLENNKKEEIIKNNISISDIEEWTKERGIDLSYQNEIQSLMNRMEVYRVADKFIINTREEINGFKIDISIAEVKAQYSTALQYDTAEKIEEIILRFDRDTLAIKNGIEGEAPKFYTEYKEILNNVPKVKYIFNSNDDGGAYGGYLKLGSDEIHLMDMSVHAHEYCHFLFDNSFKEKGIDISSPLSLWIDEGIANYLDVVYSEAYIKNIEYGFYVISDITEHLEGQGLTGSQLEAIQELNYHELSILVENNIDIYNIDEIVKE
ncbi:hypothetical protein CIW83_00430 [Tissierella sp. P1]|uniref:hypothetical protein n=1 Tax=Tissierella sp. P1 TaxID=1280483 RepID=UPI000BA18D44|nr:hypothetical protein [Tissierella sp. P1]OZV13942.1 hypothetical protein CIW83_00430 [Tissierella sp. P1]